METARDRRQNALSIDVEDWFHPELIKNSVPEEEKVWQIEQSMRIILELLAKYQVKATFFVLGQVAENFPLLIKEIAEKGHEIGSHGMSHRTLWELNSEAFSSELHDFDLLIKKILGEDYRIKGFRAPTFSLDSTTAYALSCLKKCHYIYDSSVFPAKNFLYGVHDAPVGIYKPNFSDLKSENTAENFIEFPMTVYQSGKFRIPVSGGFYLRVMPYSLLKFLLKRINLQRPFVIYFHPWEIYTQTPKIQSLSKKNYFISYYGIGKTLKKIERLLKDFKFTSLSNILGDKLYDQPDNPGRS